MAKAGSRQQRRTTDARPEFLVLGLLRGGSSHGYELYRRFGQSLGKVWRISQSQLYATLKRLEARGLIAGTGTPGSNGAEPGSPESVGLESVGLESAGPERRAYMLTAAGSTYFDQWLQTPSAPSARSIRLEFVARLYFARVSGLADVRALLRLQRATVAAELARHQREFDALQAEDVFNRLGLGFRLHQLKAIYDWLETLDGEL